MKPSLAALFTGSLLVLTACSGSQEANEPSAQDAVQVLHDAVDATLATDSMAIESEADLEFMGKEITFGVEGEIDYATLVGDVTLHTRQGGAGGEVQIRSNGTTAWVRPEGSGVPPLPQGKEWAEGEVSALAAGGSMEQSGLVGVVIALRGADEVEVGGSKEIDGEPTRRYTTTIVYADAVEAAGADREALNSSLSLTGFDDADLVIDVWIGDDGVIRNFELVIDEQGNSIGGTYDLEISEVGAGVSAPDAPPAEDVLSGPEGAAYFAQLSGD